MMNLRQEIRKIVQEAFGVNITTTKLAKGLAVQTMERINFEREKILRDRFTNPFQSSYETSDEVAENIKIRKISIRTIIYRDRKAGIEENKVDGDYDTGETRQYTTVNELYYQIHININIYNWDYETNLTKKIESALSHELLHAMDDVKRIDQKAYTKLLYKTRNQIKALNQNLFNQYPDLKEFMHIFYLHLPEEINARVDQLYLDLEEHKDWDFEDLFNAANRTSVFRDLTQMEEYNASGLLKNVPLDIQQRFINNFFITLEEKREEYEYEREVVNIPREPEKFFSFWEDKFQKNASYFRKKALKLLHKIKEIEIDETHNSNAVYNILSESMIKELFPNYGRE